MADRYGSDLSKSDREAIVAKLTGQFDYAVREWEEIRRDGALDMRAVAGDIWDQRERNLRKAAGRPCLSLDELGQYVNPLINDVRQHKRSIKVTPIGTKLKQPLARLCENLMRQIEYRSNAQIAYTTMFENTVQRSYGYLRVKPRYEHPRSFHQELIIEPFVNPDMVTPDPDDLSPVGADMKFCFVHEWWNIQDFRRRWPEAAVSTEALKQYQRDRPTWWRGDRVQVAEYWTIEPEDRELVQLQTPQGFVEVFEDELDDPGADANPEVQRRWLQRFGLLAEAVRRGQAPIVNRRTVEYPYVCQYMTNGIELLPPNPERPKNLKNPWPGTSIPIVACYGTILWVDENGGPKQPGSGVTQDESDGTGSKRKILSLVRLARDPAMLYCYYRTSQAELVGMTPRTPFIGYEGQFRGHEETWQKVAHEPVAYLEAHAKTDEAGVDVLPLPQRQPYDPPIERLEIGAESARRAIQAAMGIMPLPTQAQRRNEKSGVALERIEATTQKGSFHFVDHYDMAITRTGAILEELIPHYYDAARDVTVRTATDETKTVRINDPDSVDPESGGPLMLSDTGFDVTLSTGPNQESEREAASDFADQLAGNPAVIPVIGDLVVKLKNLGPIGDEISKRLLAVAPPPVQQAASQGEDGQPNPMLLQQQMAQMGQMLDLLTKELQEKTRVIETDQVKAEADLQKSREDNAAKLQIEKMKVIAELLKVRATLEAKQTEAMIDQATAEMDREVAAAGEREERQAAAVEGDKDRAQASSEADKDRQASASESERDRQFQRAEGAATRAFEGDQAERDRKTAAAKPKTFST